jgi:acyl-CoA hydrolase
MKLVSLAEAVSHIKSGNRIFIQGAAMTPLPLIQAMCERSSELKEVEIVHLHTEGNAPYTATEHRSSFRSTACLLAPTCAKM